MVLEINVENIKCGGCANSIRKKLLLENSVNSVDVDVDNQRVIVDAPQSALELLKFKLHSMGYPERGTSHGLDAAKTKAKSFVSCAIGRMSDEAS
jgi:copper chaperone